ncbi:MAG: hypothetical protein HY698_08195 [Deltaproteobacteria bacterium]|nr:hypothetical protein [Deltaproteobacteria bacterium]
MTSPRDRRAEHVAALLAELVDVLHLERAAIVAIDANGVSAAAARKEEIVASLSKADAGPLPKDHPLRGLLASRSQKARELALANAALLDDVQSVMSEALGIVDKPATYDRRARRSYSPGATTHFGVRSA